LQSGVLGAANVRSFESASTRMPLDHPAISG
jgi:hypothetical protein